MAWLVALLVAAIAIILLRRQRKEAEDQLQRVAHWSAEILKSGSMPPTGPIQNGALAMIEKNLSRLGSQMESTRRDQTAEAASLQTILGSMAEGVMVVDSRHIIRRVNPSLVKILNLKEDVLGLSVLRALRDIQVEEIVTAALKTSEAQNADVSLGQVKPVRHIALVATPIREVSGESAVLLIFHDVTRLRQLEEVRREFVSNVSHELRTPLAIFQGYLENLLDNSELPRNELVEVLEILKRHSTRLNAIVEDLLILARLESRAHPLQIETVDPRLLVDDVVRDWQNAAEKKSVKLSAECAPETPLFEADAFRIEQVLHNLIDNAIKHTIAGGSIALRVAPCTAGLEFRVEDTGIGIAAADLPHIFARFYTADKARSREQGGTGLGLSIVKHIVQLHGGSVRAESTPGKGTSIIVQLPLVVAPAAQLAVAPDELVPAEFDSEAGSSLPAEMNP